MRRGPGVTRVLLAAGVAGAALGGCGSAAAPRHRTAAAPEPLQAFQLPEAGSPHADGGRSWQQYGARPVGATLSINPMTLYDRGSRPIVLTGIRQAKPTRGLVFGAQLVTLTPGFAAYSELVSRGGPDRAFGAHANFSPLRGFVLSPDPHAEMSGGVSPTVVLTATATRPGMFHIGDWVVSYRVGASAHTLTLVDDGTFCAGASGCPAF